VPAGAHSDTGQMTVEVEPANQADRVQVRARIVYANDFEPASAAVVNADAVAPDGSVAVSAPLRYDADGVYAGELTLPASGTWTVRVTATNPVAAGEAAYTPRPPPASAPSSATADTPSDGTRTGERAGSASDGDDDTPVGVFIAVAAAFVFLCGVWFVLHRRRAATGSGPARD